VPLCPYCDKDGIRKEGKSFAEVSETLNLAQNEYREALAVHSEARVVYSTAEPRNPAGIEALRKANARLDAASLAYAKALRDYRAFSSAR
jgi:hypothetical protein